MLYEEHIEHLVTDSKFLEEGRISLYFEKLCAAAERGLVEGSRPCPNGDDLSATTVVNKCDAEEDPVVSDGGRGVQDLNLFLDKVSASLPAPTEASTAWLEMVLVESSLRNRDRIGLIWPMVSNHYVTSFAMDEEACRRSLEEVRGHEGEPSIVLMHSIDRYV